MTLEDVCMVLKVDPIIMKTLKDKNMILRHKTLVLIPIARLLIGVKFHLLSTPSEKIK